MSFPSRLLADQLYYPRSHTVRAAELANASLPILVNFVPGTNLRSPPIKIMLGLKVLPQNMHPAPPTARSSVPGTKLMIASSSCWLQTRCKILQWLKNLLFHLIPHSSKIRIKWQYSMCCHASNRDDAAGELAPHSRRLPF